jgi:hypothetical protein
VIGKLFADVVLIYQKLATLNSLPKGEKSYEFDAKEQIL